MYMTRKFIMAILHGKQGLLCDKNGSTDKLTPIWRYPANTVLAGYNCFYIDNLTVAQNTKFVLGENPSEHHFLLYLPCFQNSASLELINL